MTKLLSGLAAGAFLLALSLATLVLLGGTAQAADGCGRASWYGTESGNRTANGEPFNGTSMTAAHKTMPFGTKLRVTHQGKSVTVRINDRGPFKKGRVLDLSHAAADRIGLTGPGVARVCWERVR